MPKLPALLLVAAIACLAVVPSVSAAEVVRAPTKVEKRGIKKAIKQSGATTRYLKAIVVHRKNPKYAAACFHHPQAGFEGTVFKRVSRTRWRVVTGGSGWTGNRPVRQLLAPCASAAA